MAHFLTRYRELLTNVAVSAASVVFVLIVCELVVFRFILPSGTAPDNAYIDDVVRYAPGQTGVWRVRNEIAAHHAINAQGWNSGVGDYVAARAPGVRRIAIVGDSYIEAFQVPPDASVAERLADVWFESRGVPGEVYRFGMSGAPLSQYVHMARREVADFSPDWLIVLLIHNDFDESFRLQPGRYASSFLKFDVEEGRVVAERPPAPLQPSPYGWFRNFATLRFLVYRWQVRPDVIWANLFSSASTAVVPTAETPAASPPTADDPAETQLAEDALTDEFAANVNIGRLKTERSELRAVTSYGFEQLQKAADQMGARLLLVMDGDRRSIEVGNPQGPALYLNSLAAEVARDQNIAFVDLQPVFLADWHTHGRRFGHEVDNHWNAYGHGVAARAIAERLRLIDTDE